MRWVILKTVMSFQMQCTQLQGKRRKLEAYDMQQRHDKRLRASEAMPVLIQPTD